ncbi:Universal stress protein A family protein [Lachnellula suecica]|uniref:Universal stress protein A family protein n=1 Tax=Lachnellula suecica TaxID=602035 RepID=A0A8T9C8J5_9HELO|nr:Universal stress protein A family protein [Lachnellula suecica]
MSSSSNPHNSPSPSSSQRRPESASSPPVSPLTVAGADSYITSPRLDPIIEHVVAVHSTQRERSVSIASANISFKVPPAAAGASLPVPAGASRSRGSSPPPPSRFQNHVSFDNFEAVEPTKNNSISFCLNMKHVGYQYKRRSRTFMVGIDENDYSDIALGWMLNELVDDGDEIVCLRVLEKGAKTIYGTTTAPPDKNRVQKEAQNIMDHVQRKNDVNRAISIVVEVAVGKVNKTFMKMIETYEPAMLIVGTKGRSLGGVQGLVSQRNSFSKWLLQYSPIPVVVVRPTEKRIKKKNKREADPARQDYARILRESGIEEHETHSETTHDDFETSNTPDGEAHAVAAALGLPASFDPTISRSMYLPGSSALRKVDSGNSDVTSISKSSISPDSRPNSPSAVMKSPKSAQLDSPDESSEDEDDEGEFDVTSGRALLDNNEQPEPEIEKKLKLHDMEVEEAKALLAPGSRKMSVGSVDSSRSSQGQGGAPTGEDDEDDG